MIKEVFKWGVNIAQEAVYISVGWRSVPSRLRREVKPVKAYDQAWRTWWQIWWLFLCGLFQFDSLKCFATVHHTFCQNFEDYSRLILVFIQPEIALIMSFNFRLEGSTFFHPTFSTFTLPPLLPGSILYVPWCVALRQALSSYQLTALLWQPSSSSSAIGSSPRATASHLFMSSLSSSSSLPSVYC